MKKVLIALLSALMIFGLVGCGTTPKTDPTSSAPTKKVYSYVYTADIDNLDYVTTDKTADHEHSVNFIEGLLENDPSGAYVGAGAESWSTNDDATVWTFKIREGIKWVTATGEEYADYTANDYVTGLQHAADFNSQTIGLVKPLIKGLADYVDGVNTDFSAVGVKALDDYTLEYTMEEPVPYFYTMTTYAILFPINETFLNSKGAGCALGAPDKTTCSFGANTADSILYSGPFIMTTNDAKSHLVYEKNPTYWDLDNVHIDEVNLVYDDGTDVYAHIKGFEQGTYVMAILQGAWEDLAAYKEKYKDNLTQSVPDAYAFGINWNFNRMIYEDTAHTTDEDKANTQAAILNKNFRLAVQAAFDRETYIGTRRGADIASASLRNINGVPNLVTASDGRNYAELIAEEYEALTGKAINLQDGQDPYYDPSSVMGYIDAAKAEGIVFPITLDVQMIATNVALVNQMNSMKESIERNTEGNIIINVELQPEDDVYNTCYYNDDPAMSDYDFNTFSGWGPDYVDPKTFSDIYNIHDGAYLKNVGFYPYGDDAQSDAAIEATGFDYYQQLLDEADAIKGDLDARYQAYAKADAYLLSEALFIPVNMQGVSFRVTRIVPYSAPYALAGITNYKRKYLQIQDEIVTTAQWQAARDAWMSGK